MKKIVHPTLSILFLLLFSNVRAQTFSATIHVSDGVSGLQGASIMLNGNSALTDVNGNSIFSGLADGAYPYSVSLSCYQVGNGTITISGSNETDTVTLVPDTANNAFFFITEVGGPPTASLGATVTLFNANNNFSFLTSDPFGGEMIGNVPYGSYSYSISKPCFQTDTGTVTIDCNGGMGISVFSMLAPDTANNAFFFITEAGGPPTASLGTTVTLFNANNNFSFVTSDPFGGEMIGNVPYGSYSYSISKPCFQTDTGTVTIDCNGGMGISVFSMLAPDTANNAFFFITEAGGPPTASLGTTVTLFNANNNFSFVTSDPFGGEMIGNVPYGSYSYSISKPCFQTDTGTVTIDCNGGMGISVFSMLAPDTIIAAVFDTICPGENYVFGNQVLTVSGSYSEVFTSVEGCDSTVNLELQVNSINVNVTQNGIVLTVDSSDANPTFQWIDCQNGDTLITGATQNSYTPVVNGSYAVIVTENGCSDTSACTVVNTVGVEDEFAYKINIFPNPVSEVLTIDMNENFGPVDIQIISLQGKVLVRKTSVSDKKIQLDMRPFSEGLYFVHIISEKARYRQQIFRQ